MNWCGLELELGLGLGLAAAAGLAGCGGADRSAELHASPAAEAAVGLRRGLAAGRNVVVIVVDTLRADRLPCYGGPPDNAPFLNELAGRSVVFEQAWAASSWTAPSTASIFTSLYPNEHGVTMGLKVYTGLKEGGAGLELNRIPDELETLPAFLKSRGYRTYGLADNPNVGERLGFERGFDRFVNLPNERRTRDADQMNRVLAEWLAELRDGGPFFLYLHYMDPHAPYTRHEQWIAAGSPAPQDPRDDLAAYDSEIRFVDERIREVFEWLDLDDNALVFFTSDHGQEFRDHGGTGHRFTLYSELTWVPLLVHLSGPGAPAGRVRRNASNMDILPTLRELLGAAPSPQDQGRSLVDDLWSQGGDERSLFAMRTNHRDGVRYEKRAIVHGGFKLVVTEPGGTVELFDLRADPREQRNLAGEQAKLAAELRRRLELQEQGAARYRHASAGVFQPTAEEAALLAELGYVDDGEEEQ